MSAKRNIGDVDILAGLEHVETLTADRATFLHNRRSGAILASNAFGAALIDGLRRGGSVEAGVRETAAALGAPDEAIAPAARDILVLWAEAGLFLTAPPPFPDPVVYRDADGAAEYAFHLGANAVAVRSEHADLAADVARALRPMALAASGGAEAPGVKLDVLVDDRGFGLFRDGVPVWGVASYELTRFHLLREIMDVLAGPERISAHLHASAVARGGSGIVIAGASGSGKSTLATALLGAGAGLAADDHVAVDHAGEHLIAFPTRLNLKPGALDLADIRAVIAARQDAEAAPDLAPGTSVRLSAFIFPHYDATAANSVTPVTATEALQRLVQTGSRISRTNTSLRPLLDALQTRPALDLSYRDTGFAVATCLEMLRA